MPGYPPNTVLLASPGASGPFRPQEKIASESILPGHLVEFVPSGGDAGQLRKHAGAGLSAAPWFAFEALTPDASATTHPLDTPYQDGETMRWFDGSNCLVYALVPANAPAIVTGDQLTSNGDGTLKKGNGTTDVVVARAAESLNNSAGGTPARIRVYPQ